MAPTAEPPATGETGQTSRADAAQDARLDDLEVAEARRAEALRLDRRFELTEAVLLSLAAVLAAWAGFQAARWSGQQSDAYNDAGAARVEAVRASTLADQERTVDVVLFTQWLAALDAEGAFDVPPVAGEVYEPDPTVLSGFLYERFRDEFTPAVHAWVATQPRLDPNAPPTPFSMPEYSIAADAQADELERRADAFTAAGRQANERSDRYVLMTIMFATVLFFAGISSKLDTARARGFLIAAGATMLVISTAVVLTFPKEL